MAQFDAFRLPDGEIVVDCQADFVSDLNTRLVVPLQPEGEGAQVSARLNPFVVVGGERLILKTHFAASIDKRLLRDRVGSLGDYEYQIKGALDMLISGI